MFGFMSVFVLKVFLKYLIILDYSVTFLGKSLKFVIYRAKRCQIKGRRGYSGDRDQED
jgi:hypothetical protein